MPTQVRIYTINRGMLDSWIQLFNEKIAKTEVRAVEDGLRPAT